MFRGILVWLLASAVFAFVGCGGGAATDSGAVAESSGGASTASNNEASMSSGGGDMEYSGGDSEGSGDEMTDEMYAGGDMAYEGSGESGYDEAAAMTEEMYAGAEGYPGADATELDAATMEGGAEGYPGGSTEYAGAEGVGMEGEYPGGLGGGAVEKIPEGLDGKAELSFRRGKDKDALQFLYAYALTTDAGAESLLPTMRWVGALRQPKLAVRWGIGFVVTAPPNFPGDPKPVGSNQNIPKRGAARGGDGGGNEGDVGGGGEGDYGTDGGGGGGGKNALLSKGAGELGDRLLAAYTERVNRGDFGEVLKKASAGPSGGNRGNAGGDGTEGYGGEGGASGYGYTGPEGGGGGPSAGADAATRVTHIVPGLSMLGIGTQKELIDRAREDSIDAVVIIDMKLRVATVNGLVTNESTIAVLDTKTQKKLHTTRKFNNITIQQARADDKEDGVEKEFEALFEAIDANLKMVDLPPALNADIAAKRVAGLAAEKHDNPLPILVEARMYHSKGLLDEKQLFAAYEQLLGVDSGRLLATGEGEDKKQALAQWLPEL